MLDKNDKDIIDVIGKWIGSVNEDVIYMAIDEINKITERKKWKNVKDKYERTE